MAPCSRARSRVKRIAVTESSGFMTIARSWGRSFSSTKRAQRVAHAIAARAGADVELVEKEREHARALLARRALFILLGFNRCHIGRVDAGKGAELDGADRSAPTRSRAARSPTDADPLSAGRWRRSRRRRCGSRGCRTRAARRRPRRPLDSTRDRLLRRQSGRTEPCPEPQSRDPPSARGPAAAQANGISRERQASPATV